MRARDRRTRRVYGDGCLEHTESNVFACGDRLWRGVVGKRFLARRIRRNGAAVTRKITSIGNNNTLYARLSGFEHSIPCLVSRSVYNRTRSFRVFTVPVRVRRKFDPGSGRGVRCSDYLRL